MVLTASWPTCPARGPKWSARGLPAVLPLASASHFSVLYNLHTALQSQLGSSRGARALTLHDHMASASLASPAAAQQPATRPAHRILPARPPAAAAATSSYWRQRRQRPAHPVQAMAGDRFAAMLLPPASCSPHDLQLCYRGKQRGTSHFMLAAWAQTPRSRRRSLTWAQRAARRSLSLPSPLHLNCPTTLMGWHATKG